MHMCVAGGAPASMAQLAARRTPLASQAPRHPAFTCSLQHNAGRLVSVTRPGPLHRRVRRCLALARSNNRPREESLELVV